MPKLDRYLFREFTQSFLATLIILLMVSVGGVMADLLGDVADGKVPARLLLSQLGLQFLNYMPYIIPLALMLGLLLAFARLYRDSEMAVLTAAGIGPRRLLRPLLMLVVPVVVIVGLCSLWLGPWADRTSETMIVEANRSVAMAGLESGKFTNLPNNGGVVYLSSVSADGSGKPPLAGDWQRLGAVRHGFTHAHLTLEVRSLDRFLDNYVMTPMQKIVFDRIRTADTRDPQGVSDARQMLDSAYRWLDTTLAGRQWSAGDSFSLADCAAAPALFYADWVQPISPSLTQVHDLRQRLLARPSFARAVDEARPYRHLFPLGAPDRD